MTTKKVKSISTARVLIGEDRKGKFQLTVPDGCRITFGPLMPSSKNKYGYESSSESGTALRVYRGTDVLAVVRGVVWFRDESVTLTREIVTTETNAASIVGTDGSERHSTNVKTTAAWRDE